MILLDVNHGSSVIGTAKSRHFYNDFGTVFLIFLVIYSVRRLLQVRCRSEGRKNRADAKTYKEVMGIFTAMYIIVDAVWMWIFLVPRIFHIPK
jgi:prolipoprotein diacylglyceryltransferase